jgi:hypothetical protein
MVSGERADDACHMFKSPDIDPETEMERRLVDDDELRAGLLWGRPRFGHPEGSVRAHVATMLAAIAPHEPMRTDLRLLALIHDSFKHAVRPQEPWSPDNDHAVLARRFAERYIADERVLVTLELHDEPYWLWRSSPAPEEALQRLLRAIPDVTLFARFVELDAASEGKDLTFLWWFRRELAKHRELLPHPEVPDLHSEVLIGEPELFVKTFETTRESQQQVGDALRGLVAEHADRLHARGEVLLSDDGLRAMLVWRWRGPRAPRLLNDGEVVREALAAHPVLAEAEPVDARIYVSWRGSRRDVSADSTTSIGD